MKLEKNENSLLFSETIIPDLFFSEYLSNASGDFIKVYLYIMFLSKYNKDISINVLSKKLSVAFPVVQEALKYWENLGVITKAANGYLINNLQEIELHKLYKPNVSLSCEDIEKNEKNETRARLIETINNMYFQGIMSPSWYANIDLWFRQYGFDEQVMLALFAQCYKNSSLAPAYVQTVAEAWANANVKTFSDLEVYTQNSKALQQACKATKQKLGFKRSLTQYEQDYVKKWTVDFGYSLDIIEIAFKKTTSKSTISFDYLDKIITDWHSRELTTSDAVQNYLASSKTLESNKKEFQKKMQSGAFEQRTYDNFDNLYANKQS